MARVYLALFWWQNAQNCTAGTFSLLTKSVPHVLGDGIIWLYRINSRGPMEVHHKT